jgi:hypothetical protein
VCGERDGVRGVVWWGEWGEIDPGGGGRQNFGGRGA